MSITSGSASRYLLFTLISKYKSVPPHNHFHIQQQIASLLLAHTTPKQFLQTYNCLLDGHPISYNSYELEMLENNTHPDLMYLENMYTKANLTHVLQQCKENFFRNPHKRRHDKDDDEDNDEDEEEDRNPKLFAIDGGETADDEEPMTM